MCLAYRLCEPNSTRILKCTSCKKGNLLLPCYTRTIWARGAGDPAAPVAPAPMHDYGLSVYSNQERNFHELNINISFLCNIDLAK